MATFGRSAGGRVGGMLVRPPLPPGHTTAFHRIPASRSTESELVRGLGSSAAVSCGEGIKSSRSFDSGLSPKNFSSTLSPARSVGSMSTISASTSMDEGLSSILRGEILEVTEVRHTQAALKSVSDMLETTDFRSEARKTLNSGELVPDTVVSGLLLERISRIDCQRHGWLLDGFPRTPQQVDVLADTGSLPDVVVVMKVDEEDIVDRLVNRRIDSVTGKIYNLKYKKPDSVDVSNRLIRREDDNEDTIRSRMSTYRQNMDGVLANFAHYDVKVVEVDAGGDRSRDDVYRQIRNKLLQISMNDDEFDETPARPLNVALAGPPGCGKGTQASLVSNDFGMVHISTGDLLREATRCV